MTDTSSTRRTSRIITHFLTKLTLGKTAKPCNERCVIAFLRAEQWLGVLTLIPVFSVNPILFAATPHPSPLADQKSALFKKIEKTHSTYTTKMKDDLKRILDNSHYISQGNPEKTIHPMTTAECKKKLSSLKVDYSNEQDLQICGDKYMAPLFSQQDGSKTSSTTCIDKFEFPNIPCEYPVVWVRADEAARICQSVGKRLCDAHEWEAACAGDLRPPDYDFTLAKKMRANDAIKKMRYSHNSRASKNKRWSYGPTRKKGICAANSSKTKGCHGEGWKKCGSNTYPTGAFPDCKSEFNVFDLHGNAAEHMNLPIKPEQMSSKGSLSLGYTEMKGSWFIFDKYKAHKDFCRWRAPFWHGSKVMSPRSHHNYHLGFRCCKTVSAQPQ